MLTSYVPSQSIDGLNCQAVRFKGRKYSIRYRLSDGRCSNTGASTIAQARGMIENNTSIIKLVVYVWHPKSETFEHIITFYRG